MIPALLWLGVCVLVVLYLRIAARRKGVNVVRPLTAGAAGGAIGLATGAFVGFVMGLVVLGAAFLGLWGRSAGWGIFAVPIVGAYWLGLPGLLVGGMRSAWLAGARGRPSTRNQVRKARVRMRLLRLRRRTPEQVRDALAGDGWTPEWIGYLMGERSREPDVPPPQDPDTVIAEGPMEHTAHIWGAAAVSAGVVGALVAWATAQVAFDDPAPLRSHEFAPVFLRLAVISILAPGSFLCSLRAGAGGAHGPAGAGIFASVLTGLAAIACGMVLVAAASP